MKRLSVIVAFMVLAAGISARTGTAQGVIPVRPMLVKWSGSVPLLSFSVRDFADRSVLRKLKSGLPQQITTMVYAYPAQGKVPITVSALSCRVVYDLWEGSYHVQVQTETTDKTKVLRDVAAVMDACLNVQKLALGQRKNFGKYRGKRVYFAAIVELNPMSPATLQRIRRWLSRSGGDQLKGDAFFGSVVSIFVSRRLGSAEKTFRFRTRTFLVP